MNNAGTEVFLQLSTQIESENDKDQRIEFATTGTYYLKGQTHYYMYDETEVSGMEGGKTTLKVTDDSVTMRRYGANIVDLVFIVGETRMSMYETPYGIFDMETRTVSLEISLEEGGSGRVEICYDIEIKGLSKTRNYLKIMVS
jgi:uncharacterized beta-barrel protein YwiB (DUF1934 family)